MNITVKDTMVHYQVSINEFNLSFFDNKTFVMLKCTLLKFMEVQFIMLIVRSQCKILKFDVQIFLYVSIYTLM